MKVLTINTNDSVGGAARAAFNLFNSLSDLDIKSKMLVTSKNSDHKSVLGPKTKIRKFLSLVGPYIDDIPKKYFSTQNENLHSSAWFSNLNARKINKIDCDIIHLHWVQGGALSIETIAKINKPIVWTLHDMWPFSGAEHYSNGSSRYKDGYNKNNRPKGESGFDINRWTWKRKLKAWNKIKNLTIVAPSNWIADCAKESVLFAGRRIEVIHVGLDHNLYRPRNKNIVRELLDFPLDKKIILIGAMNFLKDKRKGGSLLKEAFNKLAKDGYQKDSIIYILGTSAPKVEEDFGFKTYYFGTGRDDLSLALLYSAADVFVAPSVEENFSATVFESLSCGTPVVAFNIGGMPDMIKHYNNGYLAEPFNTSDLAEGINWVLNNSDLNNLSLNARSFIEKECTLNVQANRYISLYKSILKERKIK